MYFIVEHPLRKQDNSSYLLRESSCLIFYNVMHPIYNCIYGVLQYSCLCSFRRDVFRFPGYINFSALFPLRKKAENCKLVRVINCEMTPISQLTLGEVVESSEALIHRSWEQYKELVRTPSYHGDVWYSLLYSDHIMMC